MTVRTRKIPYDYPSTPPAWLPDWPPEQQIREMFAPGLRRFAAEIIRKSSNVRIQWNPDSLTVHVGNQRAVWRRVKDEWRRNCSCGYKNDRCVHAYAAARIFEQIIESENWLRSGTPTLKTQQSQKGKSTPRKRIARDTDATQLPLWGSPAPEPSNQPSAIEVEADFHHQPGKVALRFYEFKAERRRLLRLQPLYNLGLRTRHSKNTRQWNDADRRFLRWIADRLRGRQALKQNLKLLKLSKAQFEKWQDIWADTPGRFIDRDTQQTLGHKRLQTDMHVELSHCEDNKVEIALIVTTPDGHHLPYHEVYEKLVSGSSEAVVNGHQLILTAPFSHDLLREVFSRKQPRMPRDKVCEYLPSLLENRLDIVFGPAVEHRENEAECHIYAATEGANILLSFAVGQVPVQPETMKAAGEISATRDKFIIHEYVSPDLDVLRNFVRSIDCEPTHKAKLRVAGHSQAVAKMVRQWKGLPDSIHKHVTSELQPLLQKPLELTPEISCHPKGTFVDLNVTWRHGNVELTHPEAANALQNSTNVIRTPGGIWAMLDLADLQTRFNALETAGLTGPARLFAPDAQSVIDKCQQQAAAVFSQASATIGEALLNKSFPPAPQLPQALTEIMRHYQQKGFEFIADRARYGLGAILADDMGLGKTLQILSFLAARKQAYNDPGNEELAGPALVVCPASVTGVWQHEAHKFPLDLTSRIYAGKPKEREAILVTPNADLLIVNYALLRQDADAFHKHTFDVVILDEAQYIKNPGAQITQTVKMLESNQRLALTGTPLENRALDLWSITDFLNPGFLGSIKDFSDSFDNANTENHELGRRIAPVMLRRTKEEVAPELPPRTEETITVELTPAQQQLYKDQLAHAQKILHEKGPIEILAALTRLRQICCHPALLDETHEPNDSAKLQALAEMLDEITSEGHSALVFSQFASVLEPIRNTLQTMNIDCLTITGRTPSGKRQELTEEFSETDKPQVFLLSLKAAGTGLTLTKADYVFLFDPWWNPAVERQAIDRTHRIGQDKPVMAYRLVAANTIEENVMKLKQKKAELFDQVMSAATGQSIAARLTTADLQDLLA